MVIRRLLLASVVFFVSGFLANAFAMEWNTDRPGSDFRNFDLQRADPDMCRHHCLSDSRCQAWTYVKPNTTQGPNPRCWLKFAVPAARQDNCCVSGVKTAPPPPPVVTGHMEWNIDRPGSDFRNFDLQRADPDMCRHHCLSDSRCKAWTYVKPNTTQGPNPRCWLKFAVPAARQDNCCVSGVKTAPPPPPVVTGHMEWNIDRPGSDFRNFDLQRADPDMCRHHCLSDSRCKAWTYVKPNTTQGPNPRCWLKFAVPAARQDNCCVSGVKTAPPPPPVVTGHMEWNIDRPGSDFRNFDLQRADPDMCRHHCLSDPRCKAWTYVKPNTTQGPNPRCWLKFAVPAARPDRCCVSGVK